MAIDRPLRTKIEDQDEEALEQATIATIHDLNGKQDTSLVINGEREQM